MARHYLYEAANVLLTTVKKRFALRGWGLRLMRKLGPVPASAWAVDAGHRKEPSMWVNSKAETQKTLDAAASCKEPSV
jgi:hypothetical protein